MPSTGSSTCFTQGLPRPGSNSARFQPGALWLCTQSQGKPPEGLGFLRDGRKQSVFSGLWTCHVSGDQIWGRKETGNPPLSLQWVLLWS